VDETQQHVWVVKHERYDPPSYFRLYGPFATGEAAADWREAANLPDYSIALRVCAPEELPEQLNELVQNGQLTPEGKQLP
jgi:hypothetical protein